MGPIQSGINQTITMAGIARRLYEQSPQYQRKQEIAQAREEGQALEEQGKILKNEAQGATLDVKAKMQERADVLAEKRINAYYREGEYGKWAKAIREKDYYTTAREKGYFGKKPDMYSPYDEKKSGMANDRAENIAQQVKAQNDARQRMFDQLKGVSMVSQAYLASKGYQGGVKINESTKSDKE